MNTINEDLSIPRDPSIKSLTIHDCQVSLVRIRPAVENDYSDFCIEERSPNGISRTFRKSAESADVEYEARSTLALAHRHNRAPAVAPEPVAVAPKRRARPRCTGTIAAAS